MFLFQISRQVEKLGRVGCHQSQDGNNFKRCMQFPFLVACFNEALRLEPSLGLGTIRVCREDTTLCGYRVPQGTWLNVLPPLPGPPPALPRPLPSAATSALARRDWLRPANNSARTCS